MEIKENVNGGNADGDELTLEVTGEIDGSNVGTFESALQDAANRASYLILDLKGLDYVSSAGLRVFLMIQKRMKQQAHRMVLRNLTDEVREIFTVTGFVRLLHIEEA